MSLALFLAGATLVLVSVGGGSCATGGTSLAVSSAAATTAVAGAVGVARRAAGECYTVCPVGTTCDRSTGYCKEIPCRGQCGYGEYCSAAGRCEKGNDPFLITLVAADAGHHHPTQTDAGTP